nr:RNA-dependent RNA polymerase [Erysiphe necator associated negative-stranded RNA virus 22]
MLSISALSSNDLNNFGRSTTTFFDSFVNTARNSYLGACISHWYEVNKSILASMKTSPGDNNYYVGINGSFDSITIVKMASTLDSFSRCAYSVIYRSERPATGKHTRMRSTEDKGITTTSFYTTDPNRLSHALKTPFIWVSLATWEIENNMKSGTVSNSVVVASLIDSAMVTLINRDQFAQASEQVRYFYMSSIGYGGSSADIVDKTTFLMCRHHFEVLYMARAYKMSACLSAISTRGRLSDIEDKDTKELSVAFPHTIFPSKSFSQTISSMYICNVYNKFRAFHEVSEAICFNSIMEERDLYKKRVSEDMYSVSGLPPRFFSLYDGTVASAYNYIMQPDFVDIEVDFCMTLATTKSKRYCGSASFMIGTTNYHCDVPDSIIDSVYDRLNKAPIDACTMRGSMDSGEATLNRQGIRAASAVLEKSIKNMDMDPKNVNKSILGAAVLFDNVAEKRKTFSIFSETLEQFLKQDVVYRYRNEQKDQKGHREISVLNFDFRIGALFVETMSKELSYVLADTEIANNPQKDKVIEDTFAATFLKDKTSKGTFSYDNSDQKRWGPNHNVNFFAYALAPLLKKDQGIARLAYRVYDLTMAKRAKYPESLLAMITKHNMTSSRSRDIDLFIKYATPKICAKIYDEEMAQGMCQGIYQQTSSKIHAIKTRAQSHAITEVYPSVVTKFLATSDDAEGVTYIPYGLNRIEVTKTSHNLGLRVGNLCNIVRSNPKSAYNFHIGELNSIFFKRGQMATPSLKQRIAKIDVGTGVNHIEDYINLLSAAANYLSSGGSYMGAVILSILNLTLHTEQWLRWEFVKSDEYYKPVEFGGFPVIEPISTIISGGAANLYLRVASTMSAERYSKLTVDSLLCPPEEMALSDFSRSASDQAKKSFKAGNVTVLKGAGPMGIFQMVRTDRKLSQFERRHGISQWNIPEKFATLSRHSAKMGDFLFSLFRSTSVTTLETNLGVNSFYVRMAEPWASFTRPCMKISENSPFKKIFLSLPEKISHKDFNSRLLEITPPQARVMLEDLASSTPSNKEYEIMVAQLSVRLRDSKSLMDYFSSQEAETFRVSRTKPSIQRVTLRGHSAADSDSYQLAIIKSLAGKRARPLINDYKRFATMYESIDVPEPTEPLKLVEALVLSDNAIALYNKFIRKDTKMILPNKVDTLKDLALDIIKNKFTENVGLVLEDSLELDEERSRPYAYSKWYQDLINASTSFEKQVANSVLSGNPAPRSVLGVTSERAVITKSDMFELTSAQAPAKTILVDSKSKDMFISTLRSWLSANVKFMMTRDTIRAFVAGRLTFSHDYYVGHDTFYRFAKDRYLTITAGGIKGMHIIQTTVKDRGAYVNKKTTYRHIFLFPEDVTGRPVEVKIVGDTTKDKWLLNLRAAVDGIRPTRTNDWTAIKQEVPISRVNFRKTTVENDFFKFASISPGTEFYVSAEPGSLCMTINTATLSLPVSYYSPDSIDCYSIGYKLTHADMKQATYIYSDLSQASSNFDKRAIMSNKNLMTTLDFILVGSTVDTPERVIKEATKGVLVRSCTAIQLDIVRTFLIRNSNFNLHCSSSRFNQYLLNMGKRRSHSHSYICYDSMGRLVDKDSEDWDADSVEEDIIATGRTDERNLDPIAEEEEHIVPSYALEHGEQISRSPIIPPDDMDISARPDVYYSLESWDDRVVEELDEVEPEQENMQIMPSVDDTGLFDLESDSEADGEVADEDLLNTDNTANVQTTYSPSTKQGGFLSAFKSQLSFLNDINIDDVFDIQEDDDIEEVGEATTKLSSLSEIFNKSLSGAFEKIIDDKDNTLRSEASGHTVSGNLEKTKFIISYLKDWINTAGMRKEIDQNGILSKNVSSVTGMYLMFHQAGVLESVNPLEMFFGLDGHTLPIDLSALAIIDNIYG